MAVTTGSAAASTGLSGRLRAAVDSFFSTFVRDYTVGSQGAKGLDSYASGFVAAFDNDKLDVITQLGGNIYGHYRYDAGISTVTLLSSVWNLFNFNSKLLGNSDSFVTVGSNWK